MVQAKGVIFTAEKILKQTNYIDTGTGECFTKNSYVDIAFDNEEGYLCWAKRSSTKAFLDMPLPDKLNWAEKGRAESLKYYLLRNNQLLAYRSGNAIKPLSVHEIGKHIGLSDVCAKRFVTKLKKHGIIKEVTISDQTYFMLNPLYFFKGKRLSLFVYIAFQKELKEQLPPWVIQRFADQAKEITEIKVIK